MGIHGSGRDVPLCSGPWIGGEAIADVGLALGLDDEQDVDAAVLAP